MPRLLQAKGVPVDESAISIAPLGGRHVNHFWRLLSALKIPYFTLFDLDVARHQAGWGRIKYVNDQLSKLDPNKTLPAQLKIPKWNDMTEVRAHRCFAEGDQNIFYSLEKEGVFSYPMDLDFSMLLAYPKAHCVAHDDPDEDTIKAVLGKAITILHNIIKKN